jgi:hypothetical protein
MNPIICGLLCYVNLMRGALSLVFKSIASTPVLDLNKKTCPLFLVPMIAWAGAVQKGDDTLILERIPLVFILI